MGLDYTVPVGTGEFVFNGNWNIRSGYNSDTTNSRYTWIDGYSVVNVSAGYRFNSGWDASVFARNLFDENYVTALTIQTGNSGLILGQAGHVWTRLVRDRRCRILAGVSFPVLSLQ